MKCKCNTKVGQGDEVRWETFCLAHTFKCSQCTSYKVVTLSSHSMTPSHMAVSFTWMWDWSRGKNKCAFTSLIKTHTVSNTILKAPLSILWMPKSAPAHVWSDTFWLDWWQLGSDPGHWRICTASHMAYCVGRWFPGAWNSVKKVWVGIRWKWWRIQISTL